LPNCAPVTYDKNDKNYAGYTYWNMCGNKQTTLVGFATQADASSAAAAGVGSGSGGSSIPIGAIVGGVVGFVVLLLIIGVVFWLIMRNKKKNKKMPMALAPAPAPTHGAGAGGRPDGGVGARMNYAPIENPDGHYAPGQNQYAGAPVGKYEPAVNVQQVSNPPANYYEAPAQVPQGVGHQKY
jgi:hypothetical protein